MLNRRKTAFAAFGVVLALAGFLLVASGMFTPQVWYNSTKNCIHGRVFVLLPDGDSVIARGHTVYLATRPEVRPEILFVKSELQKWLTAAANAHQGNSESLNKRVNELVAVIYPPTGEIRSMSWQELFDYCDDCRRFARYGSGLSSHPSSTAFFDEWIRDRVRFYLRDNCKEAITDIDGEYAFCNLKDGEYTVVASVFVRSRTLDWAIQTKLAAREDVKLDLSNRDAVNCWDTIDSPQVIPSP